MKTLEINVAEQVATYDKAQGCIVCGNSGYQIKFTFDEAWGAYPTKKARFVFGKEYKDVEFTGDTCPVPAIVNQPKVEVGVFVEGEDMCTTTAAEIACLPSILCVGSKHTDGKVYYNKGDSCFVRYSANADGTNYTEELSEGQKYIGIATGQVAPTDKSGYTWSKFVADKLYKVNAYISGTFNAYHSDASESVEYHVGARTEKTIESKAPSVEAFLQSCRCGTYSVDSKANAVSLSGYISNYYDQYSDIPIRFYCTETEDGYVFYIDWEGQFGGEYTVSWSVAHGDEENYITIEKGAL